MPFAKYFFALLISLLASLLVAGCGDGDDEASTLARIAESRGYSALTAALAKAQLSATLTDPGANLTLLAPTNAAFDTFAQRIGFTSAVAMVDALPAATLRDLLSYHVLSGERKAGDLVAAAPGSVPTLYSFDNQAATLAVAAPLGVQLTDAALTGANVTQTDIDARNGVLHQIDKVLVPPGVLNIVQMAQANPLFTALVNAVVATNLRGTLSGTGPFTVFAPTNDAFGAAPPGLSTPQLTTVLSYHVLGSQVLAAQIPFGVAVATVAGQNLVINAGTPPTISDTTIIPARIVVTDIRASNGVIHVVDKVLIPRL